MRRFILEIFIFTLISMMCFSVFGQGWQDEEHVWNEEKGRFEVHNKAHGRTVEEKKDEDASAKKKKRGRRKGKKDSVFKMGSKREDSTTNPKKGNLKKQKAQQLKKAKKEYYAKTGEPLPKSIQYLIMNGRRYGNSRQTPYCAGHRNGQAYVPAIMAQRTLKEFMISRGHQTNLP